MNQSHQFIVFVLDEYRYALRLSAVKRIIRAIEITPLPKTLDIALGVINVQGQIIPVIDIRKWFNLPEREINLSDQLIIASISERIAALVVDRVTGVVDLSEGEVRVVEEILPGMRYVEGVVKLGDDVIFIPDFERFLSFEAEKILEDTIKKA
ncbi:MAG: purine-binding chemotaxis protein CheW [Candidatus Tectomicrobia bacterium]|nr:purine-binding chemotaxis protein CheW [Candidatus Tectomicrobia bacterium]